MRLGTKFLFFAVAAMALPGCAATLEERNFEAQYALIETALERDIALLASDEFGGRRPASDGEEKTLAFMQSELERAGFVSGTNDPSNPWRAPVPLVTSSASAGTVAFQIDGQEVVFSEAEAAALTGSNRALVEDAALVYVGTAEDGVDASDVSGHVAILEGEPGKSPARRAQLFEQGAFAVITLVDSESAVANLRQLSSRERFQLASEVNDNLSVYITREAMARTVTQWPKYRTTLDVLQGVKSTATVKLDETARIEANSNRRDAISHNFIAKLPGTRPGSGAVLLLGHWDHFGECGEIGDEDRLCNGAADNASGIAAMIELGRRLAASGPHDRDIYVLGTTAEEWGLLGARAFTETPPLPLGDIVAAFNFDTVAIAPRGGAIGFIGEGKTALDPLVLEAIAQSGREQGSPVLAEQFLQRQDGWALLQRDVPAVMVSSAFGNEERLTAYLRGRYHSASDEAEGLELGGAIEELLLHERLIRKAASTAQFPQSAQ